MSNKENVVSVLGATIGLDLLEALALQEERRVAFEGRVLVAALKLRAAYRLRNPLNPKRKRAA